MLSLYRESVTLEELFARTNGKSCELSRVSRLMECLYALHVLCDDGVHDVKI